MMQFRCNMQIFTIIVFGILFFSIRGQKIIGEWKISSAPLLKDWFTIATSGSAEYSIATYNVMYISRDFGLTWIESSAPKLSWAACSIDETGQHMAALVHDPWSSLFLSNDFGNSWINQSLSLPPSISWQSMASNYNGQYVVAVDIADTSDNLYVSSDFGLNWVVVSNFAHTWFEVAVSSSGQFMAAVAGYTGGIWLSNDYGVTWKSQSVSTPSMQWIGVTISSDGQTVFAIDSLVVGGLYITTNFGGVWSIMQNTPQKLFSTVATSNSNTMVDRVICLSYVGQFYVNYTYISVDGGLTWNETFTDKQSFIDISASHSGDLLMGAAYGDGIFLYSPDCVEGYTKSSYDQEGYISCVPCDKGTFESQGYCVECSQGYYSTQIAQFSSNTCKKCPYPTYTDDNGSTECPVYWIDISALLQIIFFCLLLLWFVVVFTGLSHSFVGAFMVLVFPMLDLFTDIIYIMTSKFYNLPLLVLCIIAVFFAPTLLFCSELLKHRAYPTTLHHLWWLGYGYGATSSKVVDQNLSREELVKKEDIKSADSHDSAHSFVGDDSDSDRVPYPTFNGRRFYILFEISHHKTFFLFMYEMTLWIIAVALQALTLLLMPVGLIVWFMYGVFLQMTIMLSLSSQWNNWFRIWTATTNYDDIDVGGIDTESLNYGLLSQIVLETIPQLILQIINNTYLDSWGNSYIAIISLLFSITNMVCAIYKYIYHAVLQFNPVVMKDVPLDKSVVISILSLKLNVINAKLAPYKKNIKYYKVSNYSQVDSIHDSKQPLLLESCNSAEDEERELANKSRSDVQENKEARAVHAVPAISTADISLPQNKTSLPSHEIICPLNATVMQDPVLCEDGFTYERAAITAHLRQHHSSPITKLPMGDTMITNRAVLSLINKHVV